MKYPTPTLYFWRGLRSFKDNCLKPGLFPALVLHRRPRLKRHFLTLRNNKNDLVFDPYAGVGSSIIAALKHNRRAMGCEKEEKYIEIATERLNSYFNSTLKMRPLGKPVHQPTGREKVSQHLREMDFLKDDVGVEVQFGKYAFMVY